MAKQMRKVQQWLHRKIWYNTAWKAEAKLSVKHDSAYKSLQLLKNIICKSTISLKISLFPSSCGLCLVVFPKANVGK